MDEIIEIWKPIPQFEGYYEISNLGRVKRLKTKNCLSDRILKHGNTTRYSRVVLSKNAVHTQLSVHIMVAKLFIPNPNNLPIVCHKDDNGFNSRVDNLYWGTQKDNIQECHRKGRAANNLPKLSGTRHPMFGKKVSYSSKKKASDTKKRITDEQIASARKQYESGDSLRESAIANRISVSYLSQLINGGYKRL